MPCFHSVVQLGTTRLTFGTRFLFPAGMPSVQAWFFNWSWHHLQHTHTGKIEDILSFWDPSIRHQIEECLNFVNRAAIFNTYVMWIKKKKMQQQFAVVVQDVCAALVTRLSNQSVVCSVFSPPFTKTVPGTIHYFWQEWVVPSWAVPSRTVSCGYLLWC